MERFGTLATIEDIVLENSRNEYRQNLRIQAYSGDFPKLFSLYMVDGRLPENSTELIVPSELQYNAGITYNIGDVVESDSASYTIVGHYDSAKFAVEDKEESYLSLTQVDQRTVISSETIWVTLEKPEMTKAFVEKNKKYAENVKSNNTYLTYMGKSINDNYNKTIYGLMAILIGIIMMGAISMITNSFAISINERKKQYGILASVGATKRQLRKSVIFESVFLSLIGIPLGIVAGVGGMAITFECLQEKFLHLWGSSAGNKEELTLKMSASLISILLATVLGFVTTLLSAYLPARKALKKPVMEVLRQSDDIKIRPTKLATSEWVQKRFGLSGVLASKNFKRSRQKYRATVFSLFVSIVLFIATSSFCEYLEGSIEAYINPSTCYDLSYNTQEIEKGEKLYPVLSQTKDVTNSIYYMYTFWDAYCDDNIFSAEYSAGQFVPEEGEIPAHGVGAVFLEDRIYEKLLEKHGYDKEDFRNVNTPKALAYDRESKQGLNTGVYETYHALDSDVKGFTATIAQPKFSGEIQEGEYYATGGTIIQGENGEYMCEVGKYEVTQCDEYSSTSEVIPETKKYVPLKEQYDVAEIEVVGIIDEMPQGVALTNGLTFIFPRSYLGKMVSTTSDYGMNISFFSSNPAESYQEMCTILAERGVSTEGLWNDAEQRRTEIALMTIMRVFSFGFIILISLISATNVFHTISTNLSSRRREFAMLRSVGMTQKGFYQMMNYECVLYGLKAILYGLPVALVITFLIYYALSGSIAQGFFVPWYSIVISIGSVFVIVFASMLYSTSKIQKDNVIETLKNENY